MTEIQFETVLFGSVFVAIFHTIIQTKWRVHVRRAVEADLESYKSMLEDARTKLEMLTQLSAEQKLTTMVWSDPTKYVEFCNESVENYRGVVSVVAGYLSQNQHYLNKTANAHLKKFTHRLKSRIREMGEVINAAG